MDTEEIKIYEQTFKDAEQPKFLLPSTGALCIIFKKCVNGVLVEEVV